jgi:hypothetical protein
MKIEVIQKGVLADMMAILADLEQSHDCADILLHGQFNANMRVRRALYESALISYRRAIFNSSTRLPEYGSKLWKFPQNIKIRVISGLESEADQIKIIADKCIAHRANADARRVEFPIKGGDIVKTVYYERLELIPALHEITKRYIYALKNQLIPSTLILSDKADHSSG